MPLSRKAVPYAVSLVKRQLRARGPIDASVVNDSLDELHADLVQIGDILNRLLVEGERRDAVLTRELLTLRDRMGELETRDEIRQIFDAENSDTLEFTADFRDLTHIDTSAFNVERRLRVDPLFGQVTVPFNQYRSRFHITDPRTASLFVPDTLVTSVSEIDEAGGIVTEGTPKNAFNGQNESFWQREVTFPLSSDVDTVEMQIDIDVPLQFAQQGNVLTIHPYPLGQVDVTEVRYSVDLSDPSILLPGFPASGINNAKFLRFFFAPLAITKLRIKFRQRNWVEREGLKTFSYGAQEIDLALVEFDKTDELTLQDNNLMVMQIDVPAGFQFNRITNFFSNPDWEVAGSPTGVFFELYSDVALTTLQWTSLTDPDPSATPINLSALAISTVYLLVGLKYQTSTQNTPVLTQLGLSYTTQT
jgi:hypothetical protein